MVIVQRENKQKHQPIKEPTELLFSPALFRANVMHKRFFSSHDSPNSPQTTNEFSYPVYSLVCPLDKINTLADGLFFGINKWGLLSFFDKDHGHRDGSPLQPWINGILKEHDILPGIKNISLLSFPRVLGYTFNPVSFWFCWDKQDQLRAVLCEVNNTFGQTHQYLCANKDNSPLCKSDNIKTAKEFHVSPFLEREGHYCFQFHVTTSALDIRIQYFNEHKKCQLVTRFNGTLESATKKALRKTLWQYPLQTLKTISLIHWQGLKLWLKKIPYIPLPIQLKKTKTTSLEHNSVDL